MTLPAVAMASSLVLASRTVNNLSYERAVPKLEHRQAFAVMAQVPPEAAVSAQDPYVAHLALRPLARFLSMYVLRGGFLEGYHIGDYVLAPLRELGKQRRARAGLWLITLLLVGLALGALELVHREADLSDLVQQLKKGKVEKMVIDGAAEAVGSDDSSVTHKIAQAAAKAGVADDEVTGHHVDACTGDRHVDLGDLAVADCRVELIRPRESPGAELLRD